MAVRRAGSILYLDRADPSLEAQLDAKFPRVPGLLQWRLPGDWKDDVVSFTTTVTSGTVDEETLETRKRHCLACPLAEKDKRGNTFCNGCRCGRWMLSDLTGAFLPKLGWKSFKCPMGKF